MLNGKQPLSNFEALRSWIVVYHVTHVCQECNNFQDSKSIFIISDFKIFPIILWGQLNFGVLLVQRCFRFIAKEKLHFSLISSFYCCLVKGGWVLLGAAHRCGGGKKSHISYKDETWHTYTLTKEDQKNIYKSDDILLAFCWHQHFLPGNQQILLYKEIKIKIVFWFIISSSFNFFKSLQIFLINVVTILMMPAKMATLGLLKMKVFWNKFFDVIISVYDRINKILSCDLSYIVDVVMWLKFGNSSTSMRGVIITSIS